MGFQRTALGTISSKTSSTTLSLSSVIVHAGNSLLVGVGYDNSQGAPTVTWGFRELDSLINRFQSGITVRWFVLRHINNTSTRNIVATWDSAIITKVMLASEIYGANILDVSQGNTQTATANPVTGTAVETTVVDTFHLALFGSKGPGSDTIGSVGVGHTSGQRVGTVGAPPVSNITIHETWKELSAVGNCRAIKTGATSRDWANIVIALKMKSTMNRHGISPSDMVALDVKAESLNIDFNDIRIRWSNINSCYEAVDVADDSTVIAHELNGWI